MVYCELKSKEDNILRYSVGSIISDVTGEIMINTQDMGFEITKQPEKPQRNIASNRVMEKCGFIKEGPVRQGKMVSVYCDYNIYGLLREDYAGV